MKLAFGELATLIQNMWRSARNSKFKFISNLRPCISVFELRNLFVIASFVFLSHRSVHNMENLKYRYIYEYEFHLGTSAAETARRINNAYGEATAKENTVRYWFQRFRSGNFDLQNKPRGRPETQVDNEELKAIVEADPSQTTSELAAGFGVSDKTILIHLKQIGKVKKLEKWVPHDLAHCCFRTTLDHIRHV